MVANVQEIQKANSNIQALESAFQAQKKAFAENPYPSQAEREENVAKLKRALLKYRLRLAGAMNEDFSCRGTVENIAADVMSSVAACDHNKKNIKKWMKPSKRSTGVMAAPGSAQVVYQPKGVIGIIVPWNYPVSLAVNPLSAALAAGNRAMIKMSEFTPRTSQVLKEMIASAFSPDEVTVVTGEADVGKAFSEQPWDHLLFTGATSIGKHVMAAAAKNLTPVTLELGGKSPTIVGPNADLKDTVEKIAFGKLMNAGQTCIAPDYILVQDNLFNEFVTQLKATVSRFHSNIKDNPNFTAVISERQHKRLQDVLADAKAKGADIIEINPAKEDLSGSRKMPLHLVLNATDDMLVLQDEIFGPILPILKYQTMADAIKHINARPRPLALYLFDKGNENIEAVTQQTHSGGVCINDTIAHISVEDLPFGGVGPSGMGSYHGHEGFLTFSHAKAVFKRGFFTPTKMLYPPYNKGLGAMVMKRLRK